MTKQTFAIFEVHFPKLVYDERKFVGSTKCNIFRAINKIHLEEAAPPPPPGGLVTGEGACPPPVPRPGAHWLPVQNRQAALYNADSSLYPRPSQNFQKWVP